MTDEKKEQINKPHNDIKNNVINLEVIKQILQQETKIKGALKALSSKLPFTKKTNDEIAEKMIMDLLNNASQNNMKFGFDADSHSHLKKHSVWGYADANGPSCWGEIDESYVLAEKGTHQSPIDITTECQPTVTVLLDEKEQTKFHLSIKYNNLKAIKTTLVNNGHTIQVNVHQENASFITLYDKKYILKQFHFHTPSEHTEDGVHYPMEMHLVHQNDSDKSIAVIAVFFDTLRHLNNFDSLHQTEDDFKQEMLLRDDDLKNNPFLRQFWDFLPAIKDQNNVQSIDNEISFLSLYKDSVSDVNEKVLLDETHECDLHIDLFHYEGSLTTPPCTEGVKWMIIKRPQFMSLKQLIRFHQKMKHLHNARPTQKCNGRIVYLGSKIPWSLAVAGNPEQSIINKVRVTRAWSIE